MKSIGVFGVLAAVSVSGAAHARTWAAFNTCWQDFAVGAGYMCGLRKPPSFPGANDGCATAGLNDSDRLHCTSSVTTQVPPSYGQLGLAIPPPSKSLAVDEAGYVWLITNQNKIYHEENQGDSFGEFASSGMNCMKKLAVTLNSTGTVPRVLALGCDNTLKRYSSAAWATVATNVFDIGVMTIEGVTHLFYVSASAGRPMYRSGPTGSGAFVLWQGNTTPKESWVFSGTKYTKTFVPSTYGGEYGFSQDYTQCGGSNVFGRARFYDYDFHEFVGPDPSGCELLQRPGLAGEPIKIAGGGRGPGADILWILTDAGRVYGLMN